MNKIKGLDNWVESYNQPPDPTKYVMTKPKYVYVVLDTFREQIVGCFYSRNAAIKYADGSHIYVVKKLSVI